MKIETERFFFHSIGFFVEIEREKSEKRGKKVEKYFWIQKYFSIRGGKTFLDAKIRGGKTFLDYL